MDTGAMLTVRGKSAFKARKSEPQSLSQRFQKVSSTATDRDTKTDNRAIDTKHWQR